VPSERNAGPCQDPRPCARSPLGPGQGPARAASRCPRRPSPCRASPPPVGGSALRRALAPHRRRGARSSALFFRRREPPPGLGALTGGLRRALFFLLSASAPTPGRTRSRLVFKRAVPRPPAAPKKRKAAASGATRGGEPLTQMLPSGPSCPRAPEWRPARLDAPSNEPFPWVPCAQLRSSPGGAGFRTHPRLKQERD